MVLVVEVVMRLVGVPVAVLVVAVVLQAGVVAVVLPERGFGILVLLLERLMRVQIGLLVLVLLVLLVLAKALLYDGL